MMQSEVTTSLRGKGFRERNLYIPETVDNCIAGEKSEKFRKVKE